MRLTVWLVQSAPFGLLYPWLFNQLVTPLTLSRLKYSRKIFLTTEAFSGEGYSFLSSGQSASVFRNAFFSRIPLRFSFSNSEQKVAYPNGTGPPFHFPFSVRDLMLSLTRSEAKLLSHSARIPRICTCILPAAVEESSDWSKA